SILLLRRPQPPPLFPYTPLFRPRSSPTRCESSTGLSGRPPADTPCADGTATPAKCGSTSSSTATKERPADGPAASNQGSCCSSADPAAPTGPTASPRTTCSSATRARYQPSPQPPNTHRPMHESPS